MPEWPFLFSRIKAHGLFPAALCAACPQQKDLRGPKSARVGDGRVEVQEFPEGCGNACVSTARLVGKSASTAGILWYKNPEDRFLLPSLILDAA
jgi:hypothetical protein